MKVFRILKVDIRLGVYKKRFLLLALIYLIPFAQFLEWRRFLQESFSTQCTFADCMGCVFQGIYPFVRTGTLDDFAIPPVWFILLICFLLVPLEYPAKTMELWGEQYTARSGKISWWISKYLYTMICIIGAFAILLLEMLVLCEVCGVRITLRNTPEYYQLLYGQVNMNFQESFTSYENLLVLIIIPLLGILTLSILQLFLSIWIRPVIGFIASIISLVFSVYYDSAFLPGNSTMAIRSMWIDPEGIPWQKEILACLSMCGIVFGIGCILIRRKELVRFKKEEI